MSKKKMNKQEKPGADRMDSHSGIETAGEHQQSGNAGEARRSSGDETEYAKSEIEQLLLDQQESIAGLEKKVEELTQSNLRKTAEVDNMRKRVQRERLQQFEAARAAAVEAFLPVHDDLQRTLHALEESGGDGQVIVDGVKMVAGKFSEALKKYNIEVIDQAGVPFDVDLHDALMREKTDDENTESDIVLQVLENGYRMGDRTIRHAKVIVSE